MTTRFPWKLALTATLAAILLSGCATPAPPASNIVTSTASTTAPTALVRTDSHFLLKTTADKPTLVLFTDFQCPYCATVDPLITKTISDYAGRINLVLRNLPLPMHQNAKPAAQAVEAAAEQNKLPEMIKLVFDGQSEWAKIGNPEPVFTKYATQLGLDLDKYTAAYNSATIKKRIDQDYADALNLGIKGTPTLILNNKQLALNPSDYNTIKTPLDAALTG